MIDSYAFAAAVWKVIPFNSYRMMLYPIWLWLYTYIMPWQYACWNRLCIVRAGGFLCGCTYCFCPLVPTYNLFSISRDFFAFSSSPIDLICDHNQELMLYWYACTTWFCSCDGKWSILCVYTWRNLICRVIVIREKEIILSMCNFIIYRFKFLLLDGCRLMF